MAVAAAKGIAHLPMCDANISTVSIHHFTEPHMEGYRQHFTQPKMPGVVTISYIEKARGLLWSEEIDQNKLDEKKLEAEANGETERAKAIEAAILKEMNAAFWLRMESAYDHAKRSR